MGKFNLVSLLENHPQEEAEKQAKEGRALKTEYQVVPISVYDIIPSENNFYSLSQIEELKSAIELSGEVKQNLLVVPLGDGTYKLIAGHRRRLASLELVKEGKMQYEFVPCKIEEREADLKKQEDQEELLLILTNSQREKTDFEKIEEVKRLRAVLERYKKREKLPGRVRDLIAETLNTSATQVGRMDAISKHLMPEFQEVLKQGEVGLTMAYELSRLPQEQQTQVFKDYEEKGEISIQEGKEKQKKEVLEKDNTPDRQEETEELLPEPFYVPSNLSDNKQMSEKKEEIVTEKSEVETMRYQYQEKPNREQTVTTLWNVAAKLKAGHDVSEFDLAKICSDAAILLS